MFWLCYLIGAFLMACFLGVIKLLQLAFRLLGLTAPPVRRPVPRTFPNRV